MSFDKRYDVAIIGGGPAGATAALYANQVGLKAILIEKLVTFKGNSKQRNFHHSKAILTAKLALV